MAKEPTHQIFTSFEKCLRRGSKSGTILPRPR